MIEQSCGILKRGSFTSQPRFKRLNKAPPPQLQTRSTTSHILPSVNKNFIFNMNSSKENLVYQSHLSKVRTACKNDEATLVQKYLNSIRKNYDDISRMSQRQTATLGIKNKEIGLIRMKNKLFVQKRQDIKKSISKKELQLQEIKYKYQNVNMETRLLQNIVFRMKNDQVFYKNSARVEEENLRSKIKENRFFGDVLIQEQDRLKNLSKMLEDCRKSCTANQEIRKRKLDQFACQIISVKGKDQFMQERKQRTFQLQSIQLNDTLDQKNIHRRCIILTHRVADSLLESIVHSLLKRFSIAQQAYREIKTKAGISSPNLLVRKFFSYEQVTSNLLCSIGKNENKLRQLSLRNIKLKEQFLTSQSQNVSLNDRKDIFGGLIAYEHKKQMLIKETTSKTLLQNKIQSWINVHFARLSKKSKRVGFAKKINDLCQTISQDLKQYQYNDLNSAQRSSLSRYKLVNRGNESQMAGEVNKRANTSQISRENQKLSRSDSSKRRLSTRQIQRKANNFK